MDAELAKIERLLRRIESAENSGDPRGIIEMLADDAVLMAPNQPVQEGKAACATFLATILTDMSEHFDRRISYTSAEILIMGDHALDRGAFSFTVAAKTGGDASSATGKYLFIYARSADGAWQLARAIASVDAPDEAAGDSTDVGE